MAASIARRRAAMMLGVPVFDASAPALRVKGRQVSNWWANLETLWRGHRRFAVRLSRLSDRAISSTVMQRAALDAPLRLRSRGGGAPVLARRHAGQPARAGAATCAADEGGVSHFNYLRDNVLLTWMHTRLLLRVPVAAAAARRAGSKAAEADRAGTRSCSSCDDRQRQQFGLVDADGGTAEIRSSRR